MGWKKKSAERIDPTGTGLDLAYLRQIKDKFIISIQDYEAARLFDDLNELINKYTVSDGCRVRVEDRRQAESVAVLRRIRDALRSATGEEPRGVHCEVAVALRIPCADGDETEEFERLPHCVVDNSEGVVGQGQPVMDRANFQDSHDPQDSSATETVSSVDVDGEVA